MLTRITLKHINMFGPLKFPAEVTQLFIDDEKVPATNRTAFYASMVEKWLKEHPDRQRFGGYDKDIVNNDAISRGDRVYSPTKEALGIAEEKKEENESIW